MTSVTKPALQKSSQAIYVYRLFVEASATSRGFLYIAYSFATGKHQPFPR
jgi:hypothetical protein